MDHLIEKNDNFTLIRFSGSLASDLEEQVRSILIALFEESKQGIVIDLKQTDFVSSNVLGLFFSLSRVAEGSQKKIAFCNVNEELKKIFIMTGVVKHLHLCQDESGAVDFITTVE